MTQDNDEVYNLIEGIASAIMMADLDPTVSLPPICAVLENIASEVRQDAPAVANLAETLRLACENMASGQLDIATTAPHLAAGVGLLQRLHSASAKGDPSPAVDDPALLQQLVQLAALDGVATTRTELPRSEAASIDREAFSYFAEEADEHLSEAETTLLSLEKSPDDRELLDRLFRNFHTLKGAAGYANLPDVVHLAHAAENLFDEIRSGQRDIDRAALDIAFAAIDHLRALIDRAQMLVEGTDAPMPEIGDLLDRIGALTTSVKNATPTQDTSNAAADEETAGPAQEAGEMAKAAEELATEEAPPIAEEMETEEQGAATDAAEVIAENGETNDIPEEFASIVHAQENLNIDDLSTLGTLNGLLEDKRDDLAATNPQLSRLAAAMALVLENIILEECDDVAAAADAIAHGVAMLCRGFNAFAVSGEEDLDDPALMQQLVAISGLPDDGLAPTADLGPEALIAIDGAGGDEPLADIADETEAEEVEEGVALVPVAVDSEIFFDFSSEAEEHLDAAESTLLSLEGHPEDDELLNTIFRAFHTIKGASGFLNLVDVTRVSHTVEDVLDSARKKQLTLTPPIMDVILESVDLLKTLLQNVEEQIGSGSVQPRDVSAFLNKVAVAIGKKEAPAALEEAPLAAPAAAEPPPEAPPAQPAANGPQQEKRQRDQHVRVGTEKLDLLVNVVGELVIAQTQVSQNPDVITTDNQKLSKDISQLMKISNDLQEITMSMRMVPIRATFERMARMVRDLARKCDKQIEFSMTGEDTELDKNVVEEIVDPLTHMVRNACDHGVESPEDRAKAGKSKKGQVSLHAYHKGGNFVIELRDDGSGINRDRVYEKAVERGLFADGEQLSDEQVYDLIFHPGLSTADKISDVSGRGVGMDVVRRNIEKLRGKVEVQSAPGKGSVFAIRLPLTLAIIDGMVIGVGQERYILPLTSIISSLRPLPEQICTVMEQGEMVKVQDELFPLVRMHERFDVEPRYTNPCEGLVVLIEAEGNRCGLLVDELVGLQQVVIKGLNEDLRNDPCLSGCAILGDGRIGLILDANGLVEHGKNANNAIYQ